VNKPFDRADILKAMTSVLQEPPGGTYS
jgi:hypothetical protein